VICAAEKSG